MSVRLHSGNSFEIHTEMKRIITSIIICSLIGCGAVSCRSRSGQAFSQNIQVRELVDEYRPCKEFHVVNIGGFALKLLKGGAAMTGRLSGEPEVSELLSSIQDIKGVSIVDYEDCAPEVVSTFNSRLNEILRPETLVLEAKDDGDVVRIYGSMDGCSESRLKDIVISVPSDGALFIIDASLDFNELQPLVSGFQEKD